jgi:exonuclease III
MQTNPDILVLSETWLSGDILDTDINIEGYNVFSDDRQGRGGGVAILIKHYFTVSLLKSISLAKIM